MMEEYWTISRVMRFLDVKSKQTIYNWIKTRNFPQPAKFGVRLARWSEGQVREWARGQQACR